MTNVDWLLLYTIIFFLALIGWTLVRIPHGLEKEEEEEKAGVGTKTEPAPELDTTVEDPTKWHLRTLTIKIPYEDMMNLREPELRSLINKKAEDWVRGLIDEGLSVGNVLTYRHDDYLDLDNEKYTVDAWCIKGEVNEIVKGKNDLRG